MAFAYLDATLFKLDIIFLISMSIAPINVSIMPSKSSLKKQSELVREALKTFDAVRSLNSFALIRTAMNELIDTTVYFP